jgi:hypothetical protein
MAFAYMPNAAPEQYALDKILGDKKMGIWKMQDDNHIVITAEHENKKMELAIEIAWGPNGTIVLTSDNRPTVMTRYADPVATRCPIPDQQDELAWNKANQTKTVVAYKAYLKAYPKGFWAFKATLMISRSNP